MVSVRDIVLWLKGRRKRKKEEKAIKRFEDSIFWDDEKLERFIKEGIESSFDGIKVIKITHLNRKSARKATFHIQMQYRSLKETTSGYLEIGDSHVIISVKNAFFEIPELREDSLFIRPFYDTIQIYEQMLQRFLKEVRI